MEQTLKAKLEKKLSDQHLKFTLFYFESMNATESAIKAGYSKRTAASQGSRLLSNVNIRNYLVELKKDAAKNSVITVEKCIKELAKIAFVDIGHAYNESGQLMKIKDMPDDVRAAVSSFHMSTSHSTLRLHDKLAAIETIMRYLGEFKKDNEQKKSDAIDLSKVPTELLREVLKYL